MRAFQNDGSSRDDTATFNNAIVHDDGAHADKYIIVYGAAVHQGIVAYTHVIADVGG